MNKLKWLLLKGLAESLPFFCDLLHLVPGYRCQLVQWSYKLDGKFKLGVWKDGPIY